MKKYLLSLFCILYLSLYAQKSPAIGITDFNHIDYYAEEIYSNDTWIKNYADTGWDFTANDGNGEFHFKEYATGGINGMDGCISLNNLDVKYIKLKSNDGSPFKMLSILLKPDSNLDVTFKGYLNSEEVAGATAILTSTTPERWSIFDTSTINAFGKINELRIIPNVRSRFIGIDNINIAAPELSTHESNSKSLQISVTKNELNIISTKDDTVKIYSIDGKKILTKSIKKGASSIPTTGLQKGTYIVTFNKHRQSKKIIIY